MKGFTLTTEDKKHFNNASISYEVVESQFGKCLVATTSKGVVAVLFGETKKALVEDLGARFPLSVLKQESTDWATAVNDYLSKGKSSVTIPLHLVGTPFQLEVWEALLTVGSGTTCDYGAIAEKIGDRKKSRAVGTAIGNNPLGYIVPCHRVLRRDGGIGGYRWGIERKQKMLLHETV